MGDAKKPMTKSQIIATIAEECDLSKKEVAGVLDSLAGCIAKSLGPDGPGVFAIPGLVKVEKKVVPARPAKFGVPNPFKPGETMDIPAKPATTKVKVRALKALKEMA
jgi:nucleoid DNA-binding protein